MGSACGGGVMTAMVLTTGLALLLITAPLTNGQNSSVELSGNETSDKGGQTYLKCDDVEVPFAEENFFMTETQCCDKNGKKDGCTYIKSIVWIIAGAGGGGLLLIIIISCILCCCLKKKKKAAGGGAAPAR